MQFWRGEISSDLGKFVCLPEFCDCFPPAAAQPHLCAQPFFHFASFRNTSIRETPSDLFPRRITLSSGSPSACPRATCAQQAKDCTRSLFEAPLIIATIININIISSGGGSGQQRSPFSFIICSLFPGAQNNIRQPDWLSSSRFSARAAGAYLWRLLGQWARRHYD